VSRNPIPPVILSTAKDLFSSIRANAGDIPAVYSMCR